ncbi:MAG TPA: MqnA/MqnD/SBP family protein, partial [Candidatus Methanoperedens sp.]
AKRELGRSAIREIDRLLKKSIEYAIQNRDVAWDYIREHAQELNDEVIEQHINLYVNDFTLDIGKGTAAVEKLLRTAEELDIIPHSEKPFFVD